MTAPGLVSSQYIFLIVDTLCQAFLSTGARRRNLCRIRFPQPKCLRVGQVGSKSSHTKVTSGRLGAGTGIFTRLLLTRPNIAKVTAVEPAEGMRAGFRDKVLNGRPADALPKVDVVEGIFTDIPAPSGSVDLVVAAQAFHWVGDNHEAAMVSKNDHCQGHQLTRPFSG